MYIYSNLFILGLLLVSAPVSPFSSSSASVRKDEKVFQTSITVDPKVFQTSITVDPTLPQTKVFQLTTEGQEDLLSSCLDNGEVEKDVYGCVMWSCSVELARLLAENSNRSTQGLKRSKLLELGCGVGLVGLTASNLGLFDEVRCDGRWRLYIHTLTQNY